MAEPKCLIISACTVCCTLVILIVMIVSIGTVEPIEWAVKYNTISKTIDKERVYPGGWYFIGPIYQFIKFPATLVNMDFTRFQGAYSGPMSVKDIEGQEM